MQYPAYTASEMHLIVTFSSLKGVRNTDDTLKRYKDVIEPLRDEAKAMIYLLMGKRPDAVRKLVPNIAESHWKLILDPVFIEFERMAEARRQESKERRKRMKLRMYLRPV